MRSKEVSTENNRKRSDLGATIPRDELTHQLQQLVRGLQSGELTVQKNNERIHLRPTDNLEVSFRVKQKNDHERLTLELRWQRPAARDELRNLKITASGESHEPEEVVAVETETTVPSS